MCLWCCLQDYDQRMLEVGYEDGSERLLLWLPVICKHVITEDSPLANWLKPSGIMADADASIVVVVSAFFCMHESLISLCYLYLRVVLE